MLESVPHSAARLSQTTHAEPVVSGGGVRKPSMPFAPASHFYNGLNQRVLRENPVGQTVYVYGSHGHNVLGEYQPPNTSSIRWSNGLSTEHVWLPTASGPMPVAAVINGEHFAVHSDHLNTPRRLTDRNGNPRWQWAYSGFGEIGPQSLTTATLSEVRLNLRYPGQIDDANGLFYNWHRFYQPQTGRYTKADPIGLQGGWNRFAYGSGNPLSRTYPYGLAEYLGLPIIEDHLRWLAGIQGPDFDTDPFDAPNREMLARLRRGEESAWDVAFYRHEMAEATLCRPARGLLPEQALKIQKQSHELVMRNQANSERSLYHPDFVFRNRSVFGKDW